jgi:hypothetical protein
MFDLQSAHEKMLWTQTVPAAIAGPLADTIAKHFGQIIAHGLSGWRKPRRTASSMAAALSTKPSW